MLRLINMFLIKCYAINVINTQISFECLRITEETEKNIYFYLLLLQPALLSRDVFLINFINNQCDNLILMKFF